MRKVFLICFWIPIGELYMDTKPVGMEQVAGGEMQVEEGPVLQGFLEFICKFHWVGYFFAYSE